MVPLSISNGLNEKVQSARAALFILDQDGRMIGQATRWIIGGDKDKSGLPAGATNIFKFVINAAKSLATSNLTARVNCSRVVLEGGRVADMNKDVQIRNASK
jgi:hypothetical protein